MKIAETITTLIGHTPLLRASAFARAGKLDCAPIVKLECFNPTGSVKDRAAYNMLLDAERSGLLKAGATIVEPTSGNTGIGLALVCRVRGYRLILTMPDTMSQERISLLRAYGAELVLTPGADGMAGSIAKAEELCAAADGAVMLRQFDNPANAEAHYLTTAEEIWADTEGGVDVFVASVGTGGTLCGTARRLKELNPKVMIVGVEPASSPVLNGGKSGAHKIQGIGAGFVPSIYDASLVDEVIAVSDDEAIAATVQFANAEGALVGISSGAALAAAAKLICRGGYEAKNVVVLLPDGGEKYLSSGIFG